MALLGRSITIYAPELAEKLAASSARCARSGCQRPPQARVSYSRFRPAPHKSSGTVKPKTTTAQVCAHHAATFAFSAGLEDEVRRQCQRLAAGEPRSSRPVPAAFSGLRASRSARR